MYQLSPKAKNISIHALLAESDQAADISARRGANFYPRSPCGERPVRVKIFRVLCPISIHALLAESDQAGTHAQWPTQQISIHALLAESDIDTSKDIIKARNFYPRSPCGERLLPAVPFRTLRTLFLSTLSLRRATGCQWLHFRTESNFYPRSPCGERPTPAVLVTTGVAISIHALLAESDLETFIILAKQLDNFYPRSPCGERLCGIAQHT